MTPPPLSFWHPASLLATWFGSGLLPGLPGTWGSLAALPFAAAIVWIGGPYALLAAAALVFLAGLWASGIYARRSGVQDPGPVVIDEVAAQWLAIVPVAHEPMFYGVAFVAFRVFDVVKVWPANVLDRRVKGPLGIMGDDVVAALYAGALTFGLSYLARL